MHEFIHNLYTFYLAFIFLKKDFIYLFMRDRERQRQGRGKSKLPVGSLMWDSIPEPQDHALSQRQTLNC